MDFPNDLILLSLLSLSSLTYTHTDTDTDRHIHTITYLVTSNPVVRFELFTIFQPA